MKIIVMSQDECWLVMLADQNRWKWYWLRLLDNGNTINGSNNTTFDKPIFYVRRDSYYYLLLDSDILENIVNLIHKAGGGI